HGNSPFRTSTLGTRETRDLLAAINTIIGRSDVNPDRVGIWGVSLGAYVALSAATESERVKTIVVDSPFQSPGSFLEMVTTMILGVDTFLFDKLARLGSS